MSCSHSQSWFVTTQAKNRLGEGFQFNSGPQQQQYTVQLNRNFNCCNESYQIVVNNQEIQHTLRCNIWSPLCCPGGEYGWEQDGHHFMLVYNSLALLRSMRGFALFVDGVDVDSGMDFRAYWRSKGLQFIFVGLAFIILGAVLASVIYFFVSDRNINRGVYPGIGLAGAGLVYICMGLIPILRKYDGPRYQHGTVTYDRI